MNTFRLFLVAVLATGLLSACGGDDNPVGGNDGVTTFDDLVGTWNAIEDVFTNNANPSQKVDAVARGLQTVLKFSSDGRFEMTLSAAGVGITLKGPARIADSKLFLTLEDFFDLEIELEFTLEGNRLTTTDRNVEFDFDGDGNDEPATQVTVYLKA